MGLPYPPPPASPSHLYSQAIQLKLYQAFIFSVPILFSIILILLFYLFYLKKRRDNSFISSPSSASALPRRSSVQLPQLDPLAFEVSLKEEFKEKLHMVMFDEDLRARESQCCVCLGEFEMKEQLQQIPDCKHVFHIECIHHWLQANATCPLCRCCIVNSPKKLHSDSDPSQQNLPLHSSERTSLQQYYPEPQSQPSDHVVIEVIINGVPR